MKKSSSSEYSESCSLQDRESSLIITDEDATLANPTKRKHVSSISKAALARKILSKIEEENDPFANVVSKEPQPQVEVKPVEATVPEVAKKSCNCKKSKCLKLYCECFANNRFCGVDCACNGCSNHVEHDDERLHAKEQILMRNPLAFRPKIETSLDENSLFNKHINIE